MKMTRVLVTSTFRFCSTNAFLLGAQAKAAAEEVYGTRHDDCELCMVRSQVCGVTSNE